MTSHRTTVPEVGFQNNKCKVVYSMNDSIMVTAEITQKELAQLLNNPSVCLISVNDRGTSIKRNSYSAKKKG